MEMDLPTNEGDEKTLGQFNQVVPNSSQSQMMNINSLIDPVTILTDDGKNESSSLFKNLKPAKKWHWNTFKPSLKKNLSLHHWQSEDEASAINHLSSSSFSKYLIYDQPVQEIPSYTPEEYDLYLKNESWTKQETDYLLDSIRNYQCNFVIVNDRYAFLCDSNSHANAASRAANDNDHSLANVNDATASESTETPQSAPPNNTETIIRKRSVEEIKMRYNELCKKLPKYKHLYDPKYDPDKDLERKKLILSILHREEQSEKEEKNILFQINSLIDNYDRFIHERERIIANFAGDLYAFIDGIAQSDHHPAPAATKKKTTSKGGRGGQTQIATSRSDIPSFPLSQSVISSRKADQNLHTVGTSPETSTSQLGPLGSPLKSSFGPKKEKTVIGPHLRSTRLRPVRTGLTKHVEKVMTEFGLGHKPTIPSADITKQYDEIRSLIMNLIDMRKAADRAEQDYRTPTGVSSFHRKGGPMNSSGVASTDSNRITKIDSSSGSVNGPSFKIKTSLGGSQNASSRVSSPKSTLDTKLLNSIGSKDGISSPLNQSPEKKGIGHWKRKLATGNRESSNKQIETLSNGGSQNSNSNFSSGSSTTLWDPTFVATPTKTNNSHSSQFIDTPSASSSLKRRKKQIT